MARATLADVARAAGVSSTAASLVLSGRARELRISRDVEQRVLLAAGEIGYRRNAVSVGLRTGRTGTLGFVSDTVATSQLAGNMIKGALERARERDHMLLIGESGGDADDERRLLGSMGDRQVDGLVIASMSTRERDDPTGDLHVPAVLLNAVTPGGRAWPSVLPDEVGAGRAAAQLLLDAGHRDGVCLVGVGTTEAEVAPGALAGVERLRGITETLAAAGQRLRAGSAWTSGSPPTASPRPAGCCRSPPPPRWSASTTTWPWAPTRRWPRPACGCPRTSRWSGFDDVPLAGWLRPGLTTVALPHHALGRAAVDLLCDLVEGGPGDGASRRPCGCRCRSCTAAPSARPRADAADGGPGPPRRAPPAHQQAGPVLPRTTSSGTTVVSAGTAPAPPARSCSSTRTLVAASRSTPGRTVVRPGPTNSASGRSS